MVERLIRTILILALLISGSFSVFVLSQVQSESELVTIISTNHQGITVIEYKNNEGNIFDIKSIVLEVDNANYKSFKTENGWIGKKQSADTIIFTSAVSLLPGQSTKFGLKTDNSEPVFKWRALDEEGDELGSGGIIGVESEQGIIAEEARSKNAAIFDNSHFKMIPSTPRVGSSLRIIGEDFTPKANFDLYINDQKIESFITDENGAFILSTKIPESLQAGKVDFIVKDQDGNQKTVSIRILEPSSRILPEDVQLTVNLESVYHRGENKQISGTASPGSTISISIIDSDGTVLTTFTTQADSTGKYSASHRVPLDREFGEYIISVTDGKTTVSHPYIIETTQKIVLSPLKQSYEPGETAVINGTALPNQEIELIIEDPVGVEVFAKSITVGSNGTITLEYPLDKAAREGTYIVHATQGEEREVILFGVGEPPEVQLLMTMSTLNYKTTEEAVISIIGPPSSTVSLLIVDPSDKQKIADTITIGPDGSYEYAFSLNGYSPGVYTAVLTRGNAQTEERFSVGLETGSGAVNLRTLSDTYLPGAPILILGDSGPNIIIKITLYDPDGNKVRTANVFTDKKGVFTSSAFRFPSDAKLGVWKIDAASGLNHMSKDLTVLASAEGLTVRVDKSPPTYRLDELITISGTGAGASHNIIINILKSDKTEVQKLSIVATGTGAYSTIWRVPQGLDAGTYTIKVTDATSTVETTITVQ